MTEPTDAAQSDDERPDEETGGDAPTDAPAVLTEPPTANPADYAKQLEAELATLRAEAAERARADARAEVLNTFPAMNNVILDALGDDFPPDRYKPVALALSEAISIAERGMGTGGLAPNEPARKATTITDLFRSAK